MPDDTSTSIVPSQRRDLSRAEQVNAEIERRQDEIHLLAAEGVAAMLRWSEVEMYTEDGKLDLPTEPPPSWMASYADPAEARRQYRVALAACLPAGSAPVGLKYQMDVYRGAMAARAELRGHAPPSVMVVTLTQVESPESIVIQKRDI